MDSQVVFEMLADIKHSYENEQSILQDSFKEQSSQCQLSLGAYIQEMQQIQYQKTQSELKVQSLEDSLIHRVQKSLKHEYVQLEITMQQLEQEKNEQLNAFQQQMQQYSNLTQICQELLAANNVGLINQSNMIQINQKYSKKIKSMNSIITKHSFSNILKSLITLTHNLKEDNLDQSLVMLRSILSFVERDQQAIIQQHQQQIDLIQERLEQTINNLNQIRIELQQMDEEINKLEYDKLQLQNDIIIFSQELQSKSIILNDKNIQCNYQVQIYNQSQEEYESSMQLITELIDLVSYNLIGVKEHYMGRGVI